MLSHHLVPWGQGGRTTEVPVSPFFVIELSAPITLGNDVYFIRVFHPVTQSLETLRISDGAGTYTAGTSINLVTGWNTPPAIDTEYVVFTASEVFLAEIVGWEFGPDKNATIRWLEYRDDVFDAELVEDEDDLPLETTLPGPGSRPKTVPLNPTRVGVREVVSREGGSVRSLVAVSWELEESTLGAVGSVTVWWRPTGAEWRVGATIPGPASSATFSVEEVALESRVEVAVQPVSKGGASRRPASCTRSSVQIQQLGGCPPDPTALAGRLEGDQVVYSWTPGDRGEELDHEPRVGGWVLGQVLGVSAPGASVMLVPGWISSKADAAGLTAPALVLRARDSRGRYSGADRLEGFNPSLGETEIHDPDREGTFQFADTAWQDFGSGWVL